MKLQTHTVDDYLKALQALLPPGNAWAWPEGGTGVAMLRGTAFELSRLDAAVQELLDEAIRVHKPVLGSWSLADYQRVAQASQVSAPGSVVTVSRPMPFVAGCKVGTRLWGPRSRYVLLVRYDKTVADVARLWSDLMAFKQAHVGLIFIDVTGSSGEVAYAQN